MASPEESIRKAALSGMSAPPVGIAEATMVNSQFWDGYASRFKELARRVLTAQGAKHHRPLTVSYFPSGTDPHERRRSWNLTGGGGESACREFMSLAGTVGVALGAPDTADAWMTWCDRLLIEVAKDESEHFALARQIAPDDDPDPGDASRLVIVHVQQIRDVCHRSAWMCRQLSDKARRDELALPKSHPIPEQIVQPATQSPLGQNIQRLRKECGWTFEKLAEEVKLDRSAVFDHVHKGRQPRIGAMKRYAKAFSKELGRTLTVEDLEK